MRGVSRRALSLLMAAAVLVVILAACGTPSISIGPYDGKGMYALAMVSSSDVWAVGSGIMHYDGRHWQLVTEPTDASLSSIAMLSATDGWAAGEHTLLHYDGHGWQVAQTWPHVLLSNLVMLSATDGWMLAGSAPPDMKSYHDFMLHYDGQTWSEVKLPIPSMGFLSLTTTSAHDLWLVAGKDYETPSLLLHYNGVDWSTTPIPALDNELFMSAWLIYSPSDFWLAGQRIHHFDGRTWKTVTTVEFGGPYKAVDMVSPHEGWLLGEQGIMHFVNGVWVLQKKVNPDSVSGTFMRSNSDGWVVGSQSVLVHGLYQFRPFFLHYDGLVWYEVSYLP